MRETIMMILCVITALCLHMTLYMFITKRLPRAVFFTGVLLLLALFFSLNDHGRRRLAHWLYKKNAKSSS